MTHKLLHISALALVLGLTSCGDATQPESEPSKSNTSIEDEQPEVKMNSYIALFEIPATDIQRAIHFYQSILDIKIDSMSVEGMKMGVLPYENQTTTGVIIQGDGYEPSPNGVSIYLNGGDDLQLILDKVEANGGKIIIQKTPHADESGFFAMFLDAEGNRIGLNSPH